MSESPVGRMAAVAETKARKKASKTHTETAPCGCSVTIAFFSSDSYTYSPKRCHQHPVRRAS